MLCPQTVRRALSLQKSVVEHDDVVSKICEPDVVGEQEHRLAICNERVSNRLLEDGACSGGIE